MRADVTDSGSFPSRFGCELLAGGFAYGKSTGIISTSFIVRMQVVYIPPVDLRAVCLVRAIEDSKMELVSNC